MTRLVEFIRAHHEVHIRQTLSNWNTEPKPDSHGRQILTRKQQSHLFELVINMFVQIGQARLSELSVDTPSPQQLELDCNNLIESVADEAQERWKILLGKYDIEAEAPEVSLALDMGIRKRIQCQLTATADGLVLREWSSRESRLEAGPATVASEGNGKQLNQTAAAALGFNQGSEPCADTIPQRKRGRPIKFSDELKQRALDAPTNKARAQILYDKLYPSLQEVKNVPSLLRKLRAGIAKQRLNN